MRNIGFLVYPDFNILDLAGPLAAFDAPRRAMRPTPYRLTTFSERGGRVVSSCGLAVETARPPRRVDTLIVVGGNSPFAARRSTSLIELLQRSARQARRVASVCTGALLLADAKLLDGRRATTHWMDANELERSHPKVRVERDRIFVRDGHVWTSGGMSAGIDLAIALIEEDLGPEAARVTARELVVYHRRVGGDPQFSALLEMQPATDRMRRALEFAREHLHERLSVERLAAAVHVSPRQFSRLFLRATGETPAKAVERLRTEVAHTRVASTTASFEVIARQVGFASAERMRRAFLRLYGQPPQAVRRIAR
jgi:transcriptional regulator GlxA family with amidase domain